MSYPAPSRVYFIKPIGMDGPIKIGCSSAPEKRLDELSVWSPFPLEVLVTIPGSYSLERSLHQRFAFLHSHREWFHAGPELLTAINKLVSGMPVEKAVDLSRSTGSIRAKALRKAWSPERRRFMSWIIRAQAAVRRAEKHFGHQVWMPERVSRLAYSMQDASFEPTDEQVKYLHGFIENPIGRCEQRWPAKKERAA